MAAAGSNHYKADLRAIQFTLYEHLKVQQLFEHERFALMSRAECDAIIDQCLRYATEVTGPLNASGDRAGCRLEHGRTISPPGFKDAWRKLYELGFVAFPIAQEHGGVGGPMAIDGVLQELRSGANTAFQHVSGAQSRRAREVSQQDLDFYAGKVMAAKFFVNFIMPGVHSKTGAIIAGDRSALDMPDGGF